ncbi:hypothetical protein NVP1121O_079 [Vibrio phage 1.121.O._10N.286.46.C4]|nr:hypothetical protein NVP1121O_079 [Vibrio phage 1.121.O._10N.286.46.C4]
MWTEITKEEFYTIKHDYSHNTAIYDLHEVCTADFDLDITSWEYVDEHDNPVLKKVEQSIYDEYQDYEPIVTYYKVFK